MPEKVVMLNVIDPQIAELENAGDGMLPALLLVLFITSSPRACLVD